MFVKIVEYFIKSFIVLQKHNKTKTIHIMWLCETQTFNRDQFFVFFFSYRMFVIFIFCVTRRAKPYLVTHNKNSLDRLLIAGWPLCSGFTYIVVNMVNDTFYPFYCFFSLLLVFFFLFLIIFIFGLVFFFLYFVFGSCNWAHVRRMLFKGNNKID